MKATRKSNKSIEDRKKCVRSTHLITNMIASVPETKKWSSYNRVSTINLKTNSKEYHQLTSEYIPDTFHNSYHNKKYRVKGIQRIENPELMAAFVLKRLELQQLIPKTKVKTQKMFHATDRTACEKIIREGFDWRLAATKKGDKWGHGISLSSSCGFVTQFTRPENGLCYMLLCYMLERKTAVGRPGMKIPAKDCDTTKSYKRKNDVCVKYHDFTVYPAYMITYKHMTRAKVNLDVCSAELQKIGMQMDKLRL